MIINITYIALIVVVFLPAWWQRRQVTRVFSLHRGLRLLNNRGLGSGPVPRI